MKASCVIFDADGTIFDAHELHKEIRLELASAFGLTSDHYLSSHRGTEILGTLNKIFDRKTMTLYLEMWDEKEIQRGLKPIATTNYVFDFLKKRGIKAGMLTNRFTRVGVLNTFKASGVDFSKLDFFVNYDPSPLLTKIKFALGALEKINPNHFLSGYPKPDARAAKPILGILKRLPDFPKSVYYVGDNLIDLEFANANGFGFVGVLSGAIKDKNEWRAAGAKIIIKDISEIPKILKI